MTIGVPLRCTICDAELDGHNVTGLCYECKHILRSERLTAEQQAHVTNVDSANIFHGNCLTDELGKCL